ncbi:MAG: beta strand repeat-containing protein [Pseudomonadota bacterium]
MRREISATMVLLGSLLVTACGGGGSGTGTVGGTGSGTGSGGSTTTPTLTITLLDATGTATNSVTGTNVLTVEGTLLDGSGNPLANTVVSFSTTIGEIFPASGTALTNATGVATVTLGAGTTAGAGVVSASATVDTATISSNSLGLSSDGQGAGAGGTTEPRLTVGLFDATGAAANTVNGSTTLTARATLVDAAGAAVPGQVVTFTITGGIGALSPTNGTALTDAAGVATVTLGAGSVPGAGTLTASSLVNTVTVQGNSIGFQTDGQSGGVGSAAFTAVLSLTTPDSSAVVSRGNEGTAAVTVLDQTGAPVPNALVVFSTNRGSFVPASGSVFTNAAGTASVTLLAGTVPGSASLNATVIAQNTSVPVDPVAYVTEGDSRASVTLSIPSGTQSTDVSNSAPVVVTATVLDSRNNPVPGAIVTFSRQGQGGADAGLLSSTIDITNVSGVATTTLLPGTVAGFGNITASTSVAGTSVSTLPDNTLTFNSAGDGPFPGVGTSNLSIALVLDTDGDRATSEDLISADSPGTLVATVTDATGQPVPNVVVQFATGLGDLLPVTRLALTDASGVATASLSAGSAPGASTASATITIDGASFGRATQTFTTAGDGGDSQLNVTLTLTDATPGNSTNIITASDSATISVLVENTNGVQLSGRAVIANTSLGTLRQASGTPSSTVTTTTGSDGRVELILEAGAAPAGNGTVSVTVGDTVETIQFDVGIDGLQIGTCSGGINPLDCSGAAVFTAGSLDVTVSPLSAGGTSQVRLVVLDASGAPVPGIEVSFDSACAGQLGTGTPPVALASISQQVTSNVSGAVTATYQAQGCEGPDVITAAESSTGLTAIGTINVLPPEVGSIIFDSVLSPANEEITNISIRDSGGNQTARVVFQVVDVQGNPVRDETVSFELTTTLGGTELQNTTGLTDADGKVTAVVQAGFIATTVRVRASLDAVDPLTGSVTPLVTLSDQLSINTGVADQNSMTIAATVLNVEAEDRVGETTSITVRMSDAFNNPVPNTQIQFRTEYGTVASNCTTNAVGSCSVDWTGTDPRRPLVGDVRQLGVDQCPAEIIYEEAVTISGSDGDTQYRVSRIDRVETNADVALALNTDYTVDSDASGITCVGGSATCVDTAALKITYTRAWLDEDADGTTARTISEPGIATAPFRGVSSVPCLASSRAPTTSAAGYNGGMGQIYGSRSTVLAFAQGEESFIDSNGNGQYDLGEPFIDLPEAFLDVNEDGVYGNPGTVGAKSMADPTCYGPEAPLSGVGTPNLCYQRGGDEDILVDFDTDGAFDLGNGIYNGTLCPKAVSDRTDPSLSCNNTSDPCTLADQYCTRTLVNVRRSITILSAGSFARIGLRDASTGEYISSVDLRATEVTPGQFDTDVQVVSNDRLTTYNPGDDFSIGHGDAEVAPGIGEFVSLRSGSGGVLVDISDAFSGFMPLGTSYSINSPVSCNVDSGGSGTVPNTSGVGFTTRLVSLSPRDSPPSPRSGTVTISVTSPAGGLVERAFSCTY